MPQQLVGEPRGGGELAALQVHVDQPQARLLGRLGDEVLARGTRAAGTGRRCPAFSSSSAASARSGRGRRPALPAASGSARPSRGCPRWCTGSSRPAASLWWGRRGRGTCSRTSWYRSADLCHSFSPPSARPGPNLSRAMAESLDVDVLQLLPCPAAARPGTASLDHAPPAPRQCAAARARASSTAGRRDQRRRRPGGRASGSGRS